MSAFFGEPANLTPQQFEAEVESFLRRSGSGLSEFRLHRLEKIDEFETTQHAVAPTCW